MVNIILDYLPGDSVILDYSPLSGSGSITSDAYILPYSDADPTYFVANQTTYQSSTQEYREPQLKHVCNHILESGKYILESCPRCLGTGYYYDVLFNELGLVDQVFDDYKLSQELEKIIVSSIGDNVFHNKYGSMLPQLPGTLKTQEILTAVRSDIINAVLYLKQLQEASILDGCQFSAKELIAHIIKLDVFENMLNPTMVDYVVYIATFAGVEITLNGTIIIM